MNDKQFTIGINGIINSAFLARQISRIYVYKIRFV